MFSFGRRVFVSSALVACLFAGTSGEAQAQSSSFTGRRLGWNRSGAEIKVTREVGSGWSDRKMAAAHARMTGSEAALVLTRDGKWHACAVNMNFFGGITPADNGDVRELRPLGTANSKNLADLSKTMQPQAHHALVLGLDENEVSPIERSSQRKEKDDKKTTQLVNVTTKLDNYGAHGPVNTDAEEFKIGEATAIEIQRDLFLRGDARRVGGTLHHELVHLADYKLTQHWAQKYVASGRQWMARPEHQIEFRKWLYALPERELSRDDAETIAGVASGSNATTEARAYVGTFIALVRAGSPDLAQEQLVTYVTLLRKPRGVAELPEGYVTNALRADLDNARRSLDANGKKQFDAAFNGAQAEAARRGAPKAWIFYSRPTKRS